ncbi:hypothetical protein AKJ09_04275 [Labilithrix luteola]|uniref:Uncharacterized protein n=1 Tax=Labilithrix luteola TaxID=1391654 RepID=A0A0K1PW34_9BACT|nr:hypothetical protein AKJ09_04275 [Labilithrix luteola]
MSDPSFYDVPGNNCDDDGDGTVDNPPTCDGSLSANGSAEDFAKALGICTKASDKGYGLVSATFTRGHGITDAPKPDQHGVLPKFGDVLVPREGKTLGVLSTGYAQEYDGAPGVAFGGENDLGMNGKDWKTRGTLPSGFPKAAKGCEQDSTVHDPIDVVLELKAPPNAAGLKFDFNFLSGEWPAYICSKYNDGFIAYLEAQGFNGGQADNMSFDKDGNPVSVNNGFFDRCTPNVDTGCAPGAKSGTSVCSGGAAELAGTGFGVIDQWCQVYSEFGLGGGSDRSTSGGGTGWLTSAAPVKAGETFKLEFIIWDTGDGNLDSSVLLDNFTWAAGQVQAGTERPK